MANGSSSTPPPPSGWTLDTTSHLMQDYLSALDIPVVAPGPAPIASFTNPDGGLDLVVISPDPTSGQPMLLHVFPDATSCTGWNVESIADDFVPSAVVAGNGNDGHAHIFAIGPSSELFHIGLMSSRTWAAPDDMNCTVSSFNTTQLFGVDQSNNPVQFPLVVYGVTTGGDVLIVAENSSVLFDQGAGWPVVNNWCCASIAPSPALSSTEIVIQAQLALSDGTYGNLQIKVYTDSTSDADLLVASINLPITDTTAFFVEGVGMNSFSMQSPPIGLSPSIIAQALTVSKGSDVSGFYDLLFILDETGSPWLGNIQSSGSLLKTAFYLMNANPPVFAQVCAIPYVDSGGTPLLQVYLRDTGNSLWAFRLSGWTVNGVYSDQPVWDWPVPTALGEQLKTMFGPSGAGSGVPLFGVDMTGSLFCLQQDPVTGAMTSQNILQPSYDTTGTTVPIDVSVYATAATLYDADGMPLSITSVTVNTSVAATIWINGTAYNTDATKTATVNTDGAGSLSIISPAMGVGTPQLIFNAAGLVTPPVNPAQDIHDYLSGATTDPNALPTTLTTPFGIDGTALINAQGADLNPLVPGLSSTDAAAAASNILSAFAALSSPTGAGQSTADVAVPRAPSFKLTKPGIGVADVSILHKVEHAAGDIWHGIKNGAIEVADCTLKAEADGMHFLCTLGDYELDFVIHTIDDVVNVVHTIFASIKADLHRVVEWLRLVFSWEDINNTRQVLEHLLNETSGFIQNLIQNHAEVTVTGFFPKMETDIRNACGFTTPPITPNINTYLGTGTSISGLGTSSSAASTSLVASQAQVQGTSSQPDLSGFTKSPMARWVFDRARQYLDDLDGLDIQTTDTLTSTFRDFYPALTAGIADFQAALKALQDFFTQNITSPADLKDLNFSDLLAAMVDVIVAGLTFVDGFVSFLFNLLNVTMDWFKTYLTQPVNLPLISNLYKTHAGEQMTVVGLFALAHAFPLTVGYKVIAGADNAPFPSDGVLLGQILSLSSTPAAAPAASLAQVSTTDDASVSTVPTTGDTTTDPLNNSDAATVIGILGAGMQVINSLYTAAIDANGMRNMGAPTDPTPRWFYQLAILPELLEQCLTSPSPSGLFLEPMQMDTAGRKLMAGMWGCYWAQPLLDFALCASAPLPDVPVPNTLLRYLDPIGKIASSGIGLVTMGITIAACITAGIEDKNNENKTPPVAKEMPAMAMASNVVAGVPGLGQFLGMASLNQGNPEILEPPNVFYLAQTINDFAIGSLAGYLMWKAAEESS